MEDLSISEPQAVSKELADEGPNHEPCRKKPFVEPVISVPQDVLETTRFFFQAVDSGSL